VERSRQVIVALDCGRLMMPHLGAVRKFDHALTAAFAVARIAITAGDQIGAEAFAAESLLSVAPRRGTAQLRALGERLFDLEPRYEEPDYERICVAIKQRYAKRSLIVLFTDLFDPAASTNVLAGLQVLVPRHLVVCALMNDAAIAQSLATAPASAHAAYRAAVGLALADERELAIARLRARGVVVVDAPAADLSVALLDAYLEAKLRAAF
ncbi:MAG: DUF58 domain-containing protein, partial [Candidatus Dormibacteria bacterium]